MIKISDSSSISIFLTIFLLGYSSVRAQESPELNGQTLKLVHVSVRNGQHYPTKHMISANPKYERKNDEFPRGALVELGRATMYEAGAKVRQRYAGYLSYPALARYLVFAVGTSSKHNTRAKESALLFMEGLKETEQKYAIDRNWTESDLALVTEEGLTEMVTYFFKKCPKFDEELNKILRKELRNDIQDKYRKIIEALRENTGLKLDEAKLSDLYYLYELYYAERNSDLDNPSWLTEELFMEFSDLIEDFTAASFSTNALKTMGGGLVVNFFFQTLELKRANSLPVCNTRMFLISQNGASVAAQFAAFGGENGFIRRRNDQDGNDKGTGNQMKHFKPEHGGMLILETHQVKNSGDYWLKFFYSPDVETPIYELEKVDCGYPCKANKLRILLNDIAIDEKELEELCNSGPSK